MKCKKANVEKDHLDMKAKGWVHEKPNSRQNDMKLFELDNQQDEIPFDVVDDLAIFMRNDPMFYRKTFFPAMADASDKIERGQSVDPVIFIKPVVDKAVKSYCSTFIRDRRSDDVFTEKDKKACVDKISAEEMPNIKKGMYKDKV